MCTAIAYKTNNSYFGRNLDLEYSYNESVAITPRNYKFSFRKMGECNSHYAMIGMAYVKDNYPLYYDAANEKGLSIAGLNFPENACYLKSVGVNGVAPFELIPYVLSKCSNIPQAKELLSEVNVIDIDFSDELKNTPLHWMIADSDSAITIEYVKEGLKIYDNTVGVLTNNPQFDMQIFNLNNYMHLSEKDPVNTFMDGLKCYSRGLGALGLPGDYSSQSRFVKAAFVKNKSPKDGKEEDSVNQFFHILSSVEMPKGSVLVGGKEEFTVYSSCCNIDRGLYYYKTYENFSINCVDMNKENLDGDKLITYPINRKIEVLWQN